MKLVPFDPQQLRPGQPLPFPLRDAGGRLMLAPGQKIESVERLRELISQPLYATEADTHDWQRRVAAAMDAKLREGASLKDVAAARPDGTRDPQRRSEASLPDQWEELAQRHDTLMRGFSQSTDALQRLDALHRSVRDLGQRRPDGSLYYLVFQAGASTERYASHHALLVCLGVECAAEHLGLTASQVDSVGRAALTMNLGMHKLQDLLAQTQLAPTPAMRAEIERHPATSADQLERAGFADPEALDIVRHHHDKLTPGTPLSALTPQRLLAQLLCRVDVFSAKISRRATRAPMSPVRAAREACLDAATKQPDEIGAALLKAVGLYPPGSFVELASGELGIVVARGRRANLPYVASLVSTSGSVLGEPALRDTLDRRHAIKSAVAAERVRVRPSHERLLALR